MCCTLNGVSSNAAASTLPTRNNPRQPTHEAASSVGCSAYAYDRATHHAISQTLARALDLFYSIAEEGAGAACSRDPAPSARHGQTLADSLPLLSRRRLGVIRDATQLQTRVLLPLRRGSSVRAVCRTPRSEATRALRRRDPPAECLRAHCVARSQRIMTAIIAKL